MEINTPKEFFDTTLPVRFKPEKAKGIDVIAQVNITGIEGGNWTVIIKDQKLQITEGTHRDTDFNFEDERERFLGHGKRKNKCRKSLLHRKSAL